MIIALLGALIVGTSLGLLGSGGSILTVPLLVYVVGQQEKVAIAGSLLVVGSIAAIGSVQAIARRQVDGRNVLWFGLPGMGGTWLGARLGGQVAGAVQLSTFALVMLIAGALMLRPQREPSPGAAGRRAPLRIALDGVLVGSLTGFVGVGGGFMIVPAMVLLGGLSLPRAVGSSLVIIALQSLSGFATHVQVLQRLGLQLDWSVLSLFVAVGAGGSLFGGALGHRIDQRLLRRIFAWLLLAMALAIGAESLHEVLAAGGTAAAAKH